MKIIERYNNPTRYDLAPYGSICRNEGEYFIQVCKDGELATWIPLGEFLVKVFDNSILTDDFVNKCLKSYEDKNV